MYKSSWIAAWSILFTISANCSEYRFVPATILSIPGGFHPTIVADVDGDGDDDIISQAGSDLKVLENDLDSWILHGPIQATFWQNDYFDFDGDGDLDAIRIDVQEDSFALVISFNSGFSWSDEIVHSLGLSASYPWPSLEVVDYDSDGDFDAFVVPHPQQSPSKWIENISQWQQMDIHTSSGWFDENSVPLSADYDSDGDNDITYNLNDNIYVQINNQEAYNRPNEILIHESDSEILSYSFADYNTDNWNDMIYCYRQFSDNQRYFCIKENQEPLGGSGWSTSVEFPIPSGWNVAPAPIVVDLNSDGVMDLLCGSFMLYGPDWLNTHAAPGTSISQNLVFDLDRDGYLDIIQESGIGLVGAINAYPFVFLEHSFTQGALNDFQWFMQESGYVSIYPVAEGQQLDEAIISDEFCETNREYLEKTLVPVIGGEDEDIDFGFHLYFEDTDGNLDDLEIPLTRGYNYGWLCRDPYLDFLEVFTDTLHPSFVNSVFQLRDFSQGNYSPIELLSNVSNYEILDDGNNLSITESIARVGSLGDIPLDLRTVLMLDNSFSVGVNLDAIKEGARQVIRSRFQEQSIAVYYFSESVVEVIGFSADSSALLNAVDQITLGPPSTNLYGAVIAAGNVMSNYATIDGIQLSTLVLLTDGEDTQGSFSEQEAVSAVSGYDVVCIGVGSGVDSSFLESLSEGNYFIDDYMQLRSVFRNIQRSLRNIAGSFYWLSYVSPNRNNESVSLDVSATTYLTRSPLSVTYSSIGFTSVTPGVYVDRTFSNPLGVDTVNIVSGDLQILLSCESLFGINYPNYTWTCEDPDLLQIGNSWQDGLEHIGYAQFNVNSELQFNTAVTVNDVANGFQRQIIVAFEGMLAVNDKEERLGFHLGSAFPNPFNMRTRIELTVSRAAVINADLFNVLGQKVLTVIDRENFNPGTHRLALDFKNLSSGVYFLVARDDLDNATQRKLLLIK
ncbi:MAG: VWA domain-containing protein [Candidatus Delongbacteria bacterium]|nr:VWA domain-containing protein [Candidatus Delongbacteria bacterium]